MIHAYFTTCPRGKRLDGPTGFGMRAITEGAPPYQGAHISKYADYRFDPLPDSEREPPKRLAWFTASGKGKVLLHSYHVSIDSNDRPGSYYFTHAVFDLQPQDFRGQNPLQTAVESWEAPGWRLADDGGSTAIPANRPLPAGNVISVSGLPRFLDRDENREMLKHVVSWWMTRETSSKRMMIQDEPERVAWCALGLALVFPKICLTDFSFSTYEQQPLKANTFALVGVLPEMNTDAVMAAQKSMQCYPPLPGTNYKIHPYADDVVECLHQGQFETVDRFLEKCNQHLETEKDLKQLDSLWRLSEGRRPLNAAEICEVLAQRGTAVFVNQRNTLDQLLSRMINEHEFYGQLWPSVKHAIEEDYLDTPIVQEQLNALSEQCAVAKQDEHLGLILNMMGKLNFNPVFQDRLIRHDPQFLSSPVRRLLLPLLSSHIPTWKGWCQLDDEDILKLLNRPRGTSPELSRDVIVVRLLQHAELKPEVAERFANSGADLVNVTERLGSPPWPKATSEHFERIAECVRDWKKVLPHWQKAPLPSAFVQKLVQSQDFALEVISRGEVLNYLSQHLSELKQILSQTIENHSVAKFFSHKVVKGLGESVLGKVLWELWDEALYNDQQTQVGCIQRDIPQILRRIAPPSPLAMRLADEIEDFKNRKSLVQVIDARACVFLALLEERLDAEQPDWAAKWVVHPTRYQEQQSRLIELLSFNSKRIGLVTKRQACFNYLNKEGPFPHELAQRILRIDQLGSHVVFDLFEHAPEHAPEILRTFYQTYRRSRYSPEDIEKFNLDLVSRAGSYSNRMPQPEQLWKSLDHCILNELKEDPGKNYERWQPFLKYFASELLLQCGLTETVYCLALYACQCCIGSREGQQPIANGKTDLPRQNHRQKYDLENFLRDVAHRENVPECYQGFQAALAVCFCPNPQMEQLDRALVFCKDYGGPRAYQYQVQRDISQSILNGDVLLERVVAQFLENVALNVDFSTTYQAIKEVYELTPKRHRGKPLEWAYDSFNQELGQLSQDGVDARSRRLSVGYLRFAMDISPDPHKTAKTAKQFARLIRKHKLKSEIFAAIHMCLDQWPESLGQIWMAEAEKGFFRRNLSWR